MEPLDILVQKRILNSIKKIQENPDNPPHETVIEKPSFQSEDSSNLL